MYQSDVQRLAHQHIGLFFGKIWGSFVDMYLQCNTMQRNATHCDTLQHTATHCNTRPSCGAPTSQPATSTNDLSSTLQRAAAHCNTLQQTATQDQVATHQPVIIPPHQQTICQAHCTAMHYNALQRTATHCNTLTPTNNLSSTLQRNATHLNTLTSTNDLSVHCNPLQPTATHSHQQTTCQVHDILLKTSHANLRNIHANPLYILQCIFTIDIFDRHEIKLIQCIYLPNWNVHVNTLSVPNQGARNCCYTVCCSVLQCVAVCCSVLQCFAVCCSVLQCVAVCCSVLQCVAVCCSVLQCVAVCCNVLQCVYGLVSS